MKSFWGRAFYPTLLSAILCGCFTGNEDKARVTDIFPLATGNTWVYVDSALYGPDSVVTGTSEVNIVGTRRLALTEAGGPDSTTVFLLNVKNISTGQPGPVNVYVRNMKHSNYTYGAEETGSAFVDITEHLRWPAQAGDQYITHFVGFTTVNGNRVPARDTIRIIVVNPDTVCTVPAGSFACIHYQGYRLDGALHADAYYAPGVGNLGNELTRTILVGDSLRVVRYVKKLVSFVLH